MSDQRNSNANGIIGEARKQWPGRPGHSRGHNGAERSPHVRHVTPGQDLRSAARIQHQLLPPSLYTGRYVDLAAKAHPCRIVGGDFFDYQDTGHQFRLALGDVCGNGAPAAFQAALVQGILAIEAEVDDGAASTMTHLNRALCRRAIPARFVTLFMGS